MHESVHGDMHLGCLVTHVITIDHRWNTSNCHVPLQFNQGWKLKITIHFETFCQFFLIWMKFTYQFNIYIDVSSHINQYTSTVLISISNVQCCQKFWAPRHGKQLANPLKLLWRCTIFVSVKSVRKSEFGRYLGIFNEIIPNTPDWTPTLGNTTWTSKHPVLHFPID